MKKISWSKFLLLGATNVSLIPLVALVACSNKADDNNDNKNSSDSDAESLLNISTKKVNDIVAKNLQLQNKQLPINFANLPNLIKTPENLEITLEYKDFNNLEGTIKYEIKTIKKGEFSKNINEIFEINNFYAKQIAIAPITKNELTLIPELTENKAGYKSFMHHVGNDKYLVKTLDKMYLITYDKVTGSKTMDPIKYSLDSEVKNIQLSLDDTYSITRLTDNKFLMWNESEVLNGNGAANGVNTYFWEFNNQNNEFKVSSSANNKSTIPNDIAILKKLESPTNETNKHYFFMLDPYLNSDESKNIHLLTFDNSNNKFIKTPISSNTIWIKYAYFISRALPIQSPITKIKENHYIFLGSEARNDRNENFYTFTWDPNTKTFSPFQKKEIKINGFSLSGLHAMNEQASIYPIDEKRFIYTVQKNSKNIFNEFNILEINWTNNFISIVSDNNFYQTNKNIISNLEETSLFKLKSNLFLIGSKNNFILFEYYQDLKQAKFKIVDFPSEKFIDMLGRENSIPIGANFKIEKITNDTFWLATEGLNLPLYNSQIQKEILDNINGRGGFYEIKFKDNWMLDQGIVINDDLTQYFEIQEKKLTTPGLSNLENIKSIGYQKKNIINNTWSDVMNSVNVETDDIIRIIMVPKKGYNFSWSTKIKQIGNNLAITLTDIDNHYSQNMFIHEYKLQQKDFNK